MNSKTINRVGLGAILLVIGVALFSGGGGEEAGITEEAVAASNVAGSGSIASSTTTTEPPTTTTEAPAPTTTTTVAPEPETTTTDVAPVDLSPELQAALIQQPPAQPAPDEDPIQWWPFAVPFIYEGDVLVDWDETVQLAAWTNPQFSDITAEAFTEATQIAEAVFLQENGVEPTDFERFPEYFSIDARPVNDEVLTEITILGSSAAASPDKTHVVAAVAYTATSSERGLVEAEMFELHIRVEVDSSLHPVPCFIHFGDCDVIFSGQ